MRIMSERGPAGRILDMWVEGIEFLAAVAATAGVIYGVVELSTIPDGGVARDDIVIEALPLAGLIDRTNSSDEDEGNIDFGELASGIAGDFFVAQGLLKAGRSRHQRQL